MSAYCLDCGEKTQRGTGGTLVIRHAPGCPNRPSTYHERRLNRAEHERMAELLADPIAADVVKYLPAPIDRYAVALLVYLEKRKRGLCEQQDALIRDYNPGSDEMVIVVPEYEVPMPESLDALSFMGMKIRRSPAGDELPCRVALEGARFPSNMTPTWVR